MDHGSRAAQNAVSLSNEVPTKYHAGYHSAFSFRHPAAPTNEEPVKACLLPHLLYAIRQRPCIPLHPLLKWLAHSVMNRQVSSSPGTSSTRDEPSWRAQICKPASKTCTPLRGILGRGQTVAQQSPPCGPDLWCTLFPLLSLARGLIHPQSCQSQSPMLLTCAEFRLLTSEKHGRLLVGTEEAVVACPCLVMELPLLQT